MFNFCGLAIKVTVKTVKIGPLNSFPLYSKHFASMNTALLNLFCVQLIVTTL